MEMYMSGVRIGMIRITMQTALLLIHKEASSGSDRVIRGGSDEDTAVRCRSAIRYYGPPSIRGGLGFRLLRTVK